MDSLINHLQIQTQPLFDRRGVVSATVTYSYYIGEHGPFQDTFKEGEDTVAAVQAKQQERIAKLRALGALPSASY